MRNFFDQYRRNTHAGPGHVPASALPAEAPSAYPARFIAFYLPQFHAIAENDEWWGAGFTEWTNVTKALPRYEGHLQPRLPADLAFYDLSNADTLRAQAALAARAGVYGFCIHDYWFAGRKVLETPLRLLLENRDIPMRFCLNWANENWSRRWDGSEDHVLLEQRYDPADPTGYVRSILPALADDRYIRVDGRPLVMVYRPHIIPDAARMFDAWREFLAREGLGNPYLVMAQSFGHLDPRPFGLDAAAGFPPHGVDLLADNDRDFRHLFDIGFAGRVRAYSFLAREMLARRTGGYTAFPGVCPGWDNEARKPGHSTGFYGATPERYGAWLAAAAAQASERASPDERLVFINAWNEWAEGAVLEPDRHWGHAFSAQTRAVLDDLAAGRAGQSDALNDGVTRSRLHRFANGVRRKARAALKR